MTERERSFEAKFAHDAEMQFKAEMRRNKLLAEWAAALLGKSEEDAAAYVKEVIRSDFEEAGDEDVYRKLSTDLGDRVSEVDLRARMVVALTEAKAQLLSET
ncbi:hypothetical protein POI8812_01800 [Pontivivens insulae]|uniref:DUF1476 domain-containing protein n=2 Tax=Pontivivens insulae TaxID=1639689 RepID=A0A2R8AB72_9RHOB|nr:hypothetical protein DFR53_3373 [Pontivivens insulae]SPF29489.1 hypothetical protein POI8812_01800 [Pontivivens insulae]